MKKPVPKSVLPDKPGHRWQIDIINMKYLEGKYQIDTYRYLLQIIDVYSRYNMPEPLKSKTSKDVAIALEKVILNHVSPLNIQCDNGAEFRGPEMKRLISKYNINLIHGRPYHPQSQGKCECSACMCKDNSRL